MHFWKIWTGYASTAGGWSKWVADSLIPWGFGSWAMPNISTTTQFSDSFLEAKISGQKKKKISLKQGEAAEAGTPEGAVLLWTSFI